MVISTGIRMKMDNLHKIIAKERAERLISKIAEGQINEKEAIYQACNYTDYYNGVNTLQAKFVFTKSFFGGRVMNKRRNFGEYRLYRFEYF